MSAVVRYLPLVLLAAGWELAARLGLVSQLALPPLSQVVVAWVEMIRSGELVTNGASSLWRAGAGLALAIVVGAALGIAMAWWRPVNAALGPLVEMFYPMPKSALIPVTVLWLGFGDGSKILLDLPGLHAARDARRLQRRPRQRPGAGLVGAQHGREPLAHALGRGGAERACRRC